MNIFNDLVFSYEVAGANLFVALLDEARLIFWMLALMSTVWSLLLIASRPHSETLIAQVARHLLFFGFFGGVFLELYPKTIGAIPRMLMQAGHQAAGADTFFNPDNIISAGFGLAMRLLISTSNFPLITGVGMVIRLIGAAIMMIAFIFIALKVTQLLIEQHIAVLGIGVLLFAFTGSRWTWSLGEGLIRYAIHLGLRLLLLMVIFDVGKSLIDVWTDALGGPFGFLSFRAWVQLIIGPIVFAYIAWTVPERAANQLAARVQFSGPHAA